METESSAGTIVFRGSPPQFLLLKYEAGHWDFPKGKIQEGETPKQAALRELQEETGIQDGNLMPGFKDTIHYFYRREGKTISKTVVFFLAETKTSAVKISFEHIDFIWLPYEDALKKLTFDNAKQQLKNAYEFLRKK